MKAVSSQAESCCIDVKLNEFVQHMYGIMLDCWDDPAVHLLSILVSSGVAKLTLKYAPRDQLVWSMSGHLQQ